MNVECYGATRPQQGRSANEDAFLITGGATPLVALCDGAGNAEMAAKKVLRLFRKLFEEAAPEDVERFPTWASWVRVLDSSLLGGSQSTFVAGAVLGDRIVGACAGDSRAYLIDRDGNCKILTDGSQGPASKLRLGSGRAEPSPIHQLLQPRDVVLLLSDGAWTPLSPELIRRAVVGAALNHFSEVPQAVLDAASRTGRADDMTAVALRLRG